MQKRRAGWERVQGSKVITKFALGVTLWIAGMGVLGLGGCSWFSHSPTLVRAVLPDEVQTLDPARASDPVSLELIPSLFETLFEADYASDTYRVRPLLAADFPQVSSDGLKVTIRVRTDVHFPVSPYFPGGKGRRLVAADVADSLKRVAWPELRSPGWSLIRDRIVGLQEYRNRIVSTQDRSGKIEGIEVMDDSTLVIKLREPVPQLTWLLAQPWASVIAHEAVSARGEEFGSPLGVSPGTGPFRVETWIPGKKVRLKKNLERREELFPSEFSSALRAQGFASEHAKTLPFLDELEFRIEPDSLKAWGEFREGLMDWVRVPGTHGSEVFLEAQKKLAPEFEVKKLGLARTVEEKRDFIVFRMSDAVLQDRVLRAQLAQAPDRHRWLDLVSGGLGRTEGKEPPKQKTSDETFKQGDVRLTLEMPTLDSASVRVGEFLREEWKKAGLDVNIQYNTYADYRAKLREGRFQLAYVTWSMDFPDPEDRLHLFYGANREGGVNFSGWSNAEFDRVFAEMRKLPRSVEKDRKVQQLEGLLDREVVRIAGVARTELTLLAPQLRNFRPGELFRNRYKHMRWERD